MEHELANFADLLTEAYRIKVDASGKKTRRRKAQKGFKIVNGKQVKISSLEKMARSKGARRGALKRKNKRQAIKRKTAKAMNKRDQMGL